MKKILLFISIFLFFSSSAVWAQEGISSTVEVKREFEGKLLEISKSKLDTKYSDTLTKLNLKFDYSIFDRPIKDLYEFSPMQSVHLNTEGLVRYPFLFAKVLASYPWMPEADIYLQPRFGDKFSMIAYANHYSYWGHKTQDAPEATAVNRMTNKGGLNMAYIWKTGEAQVGGYYSHNLFHYNQLSSSIADYTKYQQIGADLRIRSTKAEPTVFNYDVKINFWNTQNNPGDKIFLENRLDIDALFGATIKHKHKVLLGIRSANAFISDDYLLSKGNLEFIPQYKFDYGRWRLKAGLAIAGMYLMNNQSRSNSSDTAALSVAKVYPDIYASFEAAKNSLWLYVRADGENKLISLSTILRQNPWVGDPSCFNQSTPIRAELGLNGVVRDLFSYSFSGSYSHYDTYQVFYPALYEQVSDCFENIDALFVKAEALFKSKAFQGGLSGRYTHFFDQTKIPYMVPSFIVNLFGKYNYRQRLFFEVNLNYYSSMKGYDSSVIDVPGFVDLSAKFTFAINSDLSIFAQGQNLVNQKIMYVQNYLEPGINFGLGLYLKL